MRAIFLRIRRVFLAGLLVSLPLAITIFLFKIVFNALDNLLGPLITRLLVKFGAPVPTDYQIPGIGVVATIAIIFFIGMFTTNLIGRKLLRLGDLALTQIPIIRPVYTGAKQVIDTFTTSGSKAFSKVVMLEYPRKGIFCLAFITGATKGEVQQITGQRLVNIFVPTTPNPTSGFFLMLPEEDLIELDMSVEDGVKMIVSGGVLTPEFVQSPLDESAESVSAGSAVSVLDKSDGKKIS